MSGHRWFGRKFRNAPNEQLSESGEEAGSLGTHIGDWCPGQFVEGGIGHYHHNPEATLVTSLQEFPGLSMFDTPPDNMHAPVLDIDIEHIYYPSTTPGHAALLLNVSLDWEEYLELIDVLERCGIIEPGFAEATRQRGYSACRTPWTKKPPKSE